MTIRLPVGQSLIWNQAAIDALGTISDVKLAKQLGIDSHTVQAKRRALGVAPWRRQRVPNKGVCVICGKDFQVFGPRASRLRLTCPPKRPGLRVSACQAKLIAKRLLNRNPTTLASMWKKIPGSRFLDKFDD